MSERTELTSFSADDIRVIIDNGGVVKPFGRNILIWSGYLRGCAYVERILAYVNKLNVGDTVRLYREPKNEYDARAIVVRDEEDHQLGYIPREENQVMANLMDAGKTVFALISKIKHYKSEEDKDYEPWHMIKIDIYMED